MRKKIVISTALLVRITAIAHGEKEIIKGRVSDSRSDDRSTEIGDYTVRRMVMLVDTHKNFTAVVRVDYSPEREKGLVPVKGDAVLFRQGEEGHYEFYGFDRTFPLALLFVLFAAIAVVVGRWKGVRSLAALGLTLFALLKIYIPMIIQGHNIIIITILFLVAVSLATLLLLNGFSVKSLAALGGIWSGLMITGILAFMIMGTGHLTGMEMNQMQMLSFLPSASGIGLKQLLFAGIAIGALGAVMDVAIELAASMAEIKKADKNISFSEHVKAGMRVGRDITGTMTNTLILAYAGTSLPLLIIFTGYGISGTAVISAETVAVEIMRGFAGSAGLIAAIPATVLFSAWLNRGKTV